MFGVGEFATLAQVSKRLLRYYDEIGLLKPAHIDAATGYRCYNAEQLAHLNRILVLKELGLSLEQIHRMLNADVSTDEMQGMLLLKKAEVEQTLRAELHRIRMIEARLGAIRSTERGTPFDVVVKQIPAQDVLSVKTVFESFEMALMTHQQIRHRLPERSGYGLCFVICQDDEVVERDMNLEMGCFIETPSHAPVVLREGLELTARQLSAVPVMATAIVTGGMEFIHAGYSEMGLWVQDNGYRLTGRPREITLKAPASGTHDIVTELQFPVELQH